MVLPPRVKNGLRNREDGHDVIGISISVGTIKKVIKFFKGLGKKRKKK